MFQAKKETIVISEQEGLRLSTDPLDIYDALALLEKENERLLDKNERATCVLVLYDKKGVELFQQALSLPYEGKIEEVLSSLLQGGNIQEKVKTPKNRHVPANNQPINKKLLLIVPILFAVFAIGIGIYASNQNKNNQVLEKTMQSLENKIEIQDQLESNRGKVDVFSRYFLPKLFSDNKEGLKEYISSEIVSEVQNQKGQTQAVIQESFQATKEGFKVAYVCTVKEDKNSSIKRVSFEVKADKNNTFGYKVINVPTVQDY
ncbi:hypothetical protein LVO94_002209 [Enterococcus faecalis]|nr:hypothetical protein [Enterococcus faecalis]